MSKPADLHSLVELTKTTQTLITHFQSSLAPSAASSNSASSSAATELPKPLEVIKASTTLLRSHTTTLSLLLLTPPLTPSAIISKIGDVSSGVLTSMVAAASYTPQVGGKDDLGNIMRGELRAQVRRLLGTWGEVLTLVLHMAKRRQSVQGNVSANSKGKDEGPTESEKQDVLAATGVVWEACDALLKLCADGVVGLVVKKAEQWRVTLIDAVEELKEWGEDIEDDEDQAEGSDDDDGFGDEDDIFGAANKLRASDTELKELLDTSLKKLKMVGMLYQAISKRRLKTYPVATKSTTSKDSDDASSSLITTLDNLMALLKAIPETVDDLASGFYDLDKDEAKQTLQKCCSEAKSAISLVKQNWAGQDDEFTTWSGKWLTMLDAA